MNLVSLNSQNAVPLQTPSITYRSFALQESSNASVLVDRNSPAYSGNHINERKAFPVRIYADTGDMTGIGMVSDWNDNGITIDVVGIEQVLLSRVVGENRMFDHVPTSHIIRDALNQTLTQQDGPNLKIGTLTIGSPLVESYAFTGQQTRQVIQDMFNICPLNSRMVDDVFYLVPQAVPLYSTLMVDGNNVHVTNRNIDHNDQVWKINSNNEESGEGASARAIHNAGIWSREIVRTSLFDDGRLIGLEAAGQLETQRLPANTFRIGLVNTGTLWRDIREDMALNVIAPWFGFIDVDFIVRVLSRTYNEGSNIIDLEVQYLPKPEAIGAVGVGEEIPAFIRPTKTKAFNLMYETINQGLFLLFPVPVTS